ncbi:MAG: hypothetical protein ACUZ8I_04095 [Candidatus Scalindua sp.]
MEGNPHIFETSKADAASISNSGLYCLGEKQDEGMIVSPYSKETVQMFLGDAEKIKEMP